LKLKKDGKFKSTLNSGNGCCHLVHSLLSTRLLARNVKVKTYKTIIVPVLCGCETWSLTLREERRLRVFENRVLRRIFGPKRHEIMSQSRKLHNEELHTVSNQGECCEHGMWYACKRRGKNNVQAVRGKVRRRETT
jgi:hypothetical protein